LWMWVLVLAWDLLVGGVRFDRVLLEAVLGLHRSGWELGCGGGGAW
jgi:hypothetical protein